MNFRIYFFVFISVCAQETHAQTSTYLYERKSGETANDFVERHLGNLYDSSFMVHPVLEGSWGDPSKGKKIMAFYGFEVGEGYGRASMVTFQPIGDGKNYVIMYYNELGVDATYFNAIISIFYQDADDDGYNEIFILEKGGDRVANTIEYENEAGEWIQEATTACCEDVYSTTVLKQVREYDGTFIPQVWSFEQPMDWELDGLKTATEIKEHIKQVDFLNRD